MRKRTRKPPKPDTPLMLVAVHMRQKRGARQQVEVKLELASPEGPMTGRQVYESWPDAVAAVAGAVGKTDVVMVPVDEPLPWGADEMVRKGEQS